MATATTATTGIPTRVTQKRPSDTLLEQLFPEKAIHQDIQQSNALLAELITQLRGSQGQFQVIGKSVDQLLPAVHTPQSVLDVLMASQQRGLVEGVLVRYVVTIPAGQPIELIIPTPSSTIGFVVAHDVIDTTPHSVHVTVTGAEDRTYPTLQAVPMQVPLVVTGSLYGPVSFRLVRTIAADPWEDVQYTETAEMLLVDATFYTQTLQPYLSRTINTLQGEES